MTRKELKTRIKNFFFVRIHMTIIVLGTWGAGFLTNKLMFLNGQDSMLVRYFFALIISYGAFLLLIRIWLHYVFGFVGKSDSIENAADATEVADLFTNLNLKDSLSPPRWSGNGGKFSGGGAQGSWGSGKSKLSLTDVDVADEGAAIVVGILAILVVLSAAVFAILLIVNAPTFLGELAVEMALSIGLVKGLRRGDGNWLMHVFRKTRWPFVLLLVVFGLLALVAESTYPEARTLIDVWNRAIADIMANK